MRPTSGFPRICFLIVALGTTATGETANADREPVDFTRQVRPVLADHCFHCHGPDAASREADLRLDQREGALAELGSGERAIVVGAPDSSELIRRIYSDDEYEQMPPEEVNKPLSDEQREVLRRWISEGAEYTQHWSFVPPRSPQLPPIQSSDWPRTAMDHFVLHDIEDHGWRPAPEADRATLIRRLSLDLIGLPPTPEEIDAFEGDTSEDAYQQLVDRLLNSPRYGEHMARYWLDLARYGDTHGLHLDNERTIWPYRDWVINAFNTNQRFDQFTVEQLAGDLLPNASDAQRIATGFVRCHVTTNEGGSIKEEVLVRNTVDRVETFATTWLGITAGCAVCHDHKYDPLTQREFYQLYAFFNSTAENPMDGNAQVYAPVVTTFAAEHRDRADELQAKLAQAEAQESARRTDDGPFLAWLESGPRQLQMPSGAVVREPLDQPPEPTPREVSATDPDRASEAVLAPQFVDGKVGKAAQFDGQTAVSLGDLADFERTDAFSWGAWLYLPEQGAHGGVIARMDSAHSFRGFDLYAAGRQVAVHLIHHWEDNALKITTKRPIAANKWQHVFVTYDGSSKAAGLKIFVNGGLQETTTNVDKLTETIRTDVPLLIGKRSFGTGIAGGIVDDVRVFDRQLTEQDVALLANHDDIQRLRSVPRDQRTDQQRVQLRDYFFDQVDVEARRLTAAVRAERKEYEALKAKHGAVTMVMQEMKEPRKAVLLKRGQYDLPGEPVTRAVPDCLPPLPQETRYPNRRDLAQWLVEPDHPLTARVTVNRFWQQLFGTGLVKTSEDFGAQGELPSHPELLDWLATWFIESGWDVKGLQRLIVTSATYRQSSRVEQEKFALDPDNRWLARGPRYRMDAEMIRDQALFASGLLGSRIGGASVKPYQPQGIWKAVGYTNSNTANFVQDHGEALYRRSLYTFWKRTAPPPSLVVMDAPSRETCTARRQRTNTPTAALALMNDVQYVEAARKLAGRVLNEAGPHDDQRATYMFRLVTARAPTQRELQVLLTTLAEHRVEYRAHTELAAQLVAVGEAARDEKWDAAELAAWTMVANMVLNLDEAVTKG